MEANTTFLSDFQIAEAFGEKAVVDTFERSKEWLPNPEYWGELVVVLNHRLWHHYELGNEDLARTYHELWNKASVMGWDEYENDKERASKFFQIID